MASKGGKRGLDDGFTALRIGAYGKPAGIDSEDELPAEEPLEAGAPANEAPASEAAPALPLTASSAEIFAPVSATDDAPRLNGPPSDLPVPTTLHAPRSEPDHRLGHRDRLRKRLREAGATAVADYELLEMTLFRAIPRRDTKPLAKTLLKEFGSLAGVINAPEARLRQVKGVGDAVVSEFRLMGAVSRAVLREAIEERPILSSWEAVLDYARAHIAFSNVEHFHVLFLDKKNRLIRDEIQQTGTVDHTPVYPREVVRRAIELDATALVLVHNHPSGDTTPSRADVAMTKTVIEVARPLGIAVHDHVIVGRQGHASMKGMRLI